MRLLYAVLGLALVGNCIAAPHDPIVIGSIDEFTPENGVIGGKGTPEDPFVISGWEIDAGSGSGITIRDVSANVVIRDCRITGRARGTGILLSGAQGVRVEGCSFSNLGTGVFIYRSPGTIVRTCTFTATRRGIDGSESSRLPIEANEFDQVKKEGVFLWRCHDSLIKGNRFHGGMTAIYLDSCHRDRLAGNRIEGAEQGLFLWDSFDCVVSENLLSGCSLGVSLVHTSAGNVVYHNVFLDCVRPAACDGPGNHWDSGYPAGGNWWGRALPDLFSGPRQDRPGSDGIGDMLMEIPLGCEDRYPLAAPPAWLEDEGGAS